MLVLSRHKNEEVIIELPDGIIITIMQVDIRGDKSRLGFTAPSNIAIHRKEVWDAIQKEKQHELDKDKDIK